VLQVMDQDRASTQAAGEADLRRSIEASLAERVKEEKLKLSRKALELGKQKVTCFLGTQINKRFNFYLCLVGLLLLMLSAGSISALHQTLLCSHIACCGHVLVSREKHLHWSCMMVLPGPELLLRVSRGTAHYYLHMLLGCGF